MIQFFVFGEPFELLYFAFFSLDVSDDVRCYAFQLNISFGELGSVHTFIFRVYEHFLFLNHSLSSIFLLLLSGVEKEKTISHLKCTQNEKVNHGNDIQMRYKHFFLYYLKLSRPLLYQDNGQFDSMKE